MKGFHSPLTLCVSQRVNAHGKRLWQGERIHFCTAHLCEERGRRLVVTIMNEDRPYNYVLN